MCELLVETRVALTKAGQQPLRTRLSDALALLEAALSLESEVFDAPTACTAIAAAEDALRTRRAPTLAFGR
jgi:hypothetical protein